MKALFICILVLFGGASSGFAQDQFEGKVIYLPVESQSVSASVKENAPMKVVVRAKGDLLRWDEYTEKGSRSIVTDFSAMEQFLLIEFLGMLCAIETPKEQFAKPVEWINEGKKHGKMMDQKCLSAEINGHQVVWIPGMRLNHPFLPNVEGIPVEFWHKTAQGDVLYRAISVIEEPQSATFFTVPEGYAKVKAEELSSLFSLSLQRK